MSVRIEPGKAFFPPSYISSTSQIIVTFTNLENTRKSLVFRSNPKKSNDQTKDSVDIYDAKQRETLRPASRYDRTNFHFDRERIELWPNGTQQVLLYFTPQIAKQCDETIYICTEDNSFVYPFKITGQGLPPVATFLTDCIQVGHVGLDSVLDYRVELANAGQVDIDFELEPKETNDLIFQFNPSKGHLKQGGIMPIEIRFIATSVGAFNETFIYKVKGATKSHPQITFTGKVVGPSFQITPRVVNFGNVGLGFLVSQKVTLENKSEIPFDYTFEVKTDGNHELREFLIKPSRGHIDKFSSIDINIELIPNKVRNYNLALQFGIDRFQKTILSIPIVANCVCPDLTLSTTNLDFGNVYIGYEYNKTISLQNNSEFAARYEFSPFGEQRCGELTVEKEGGIVEPHSSCDLPVLLTGKIIGNIKMECLFKIIGSDKPPLHLVVNAICTGPTIQFSHNTVNFGNINILKRECKQITISNNSLIPAKFKASIDQTTYTFDSEITEGEIAPNSTMTFPVFATVNDTLSFQGKVKFMFDYLTVSQIPLIAAGVGTPIISSIDMTEINLGYILTQMPTRLHFTLKNVSKRMYEVRLSHTKPHVPKDSQAVVQLSVEPDFVQMMPDEEYDFEISTSCNTTVSFTVQIQVNATVQRSRVEVYSTLMKATFIDPVVNFSSQTLEFKQSTLQPQITYEEINPSMDIMSVISKPLSITNTNHIPLQCEVECPVPFSIPESKFTIEPLQCYNTSVVFDPSFKTDFNSEIIQKKLQFTFDNHPQKQFVQLKAIINFPNISFDHEGPIDFGTMVANTEQVKTVSLSNTFDKEIEYKWEILGSVDDETKVFDAFPIRGTIAKDESIQTHFSFFAQGAADGSTKKYKAIAVCHVKSGPDYTFELSGSSATINYKIEPKIIDFGKIDFMSTVSSEVIIENTSNVPISFSVKIPKRAKFTNFNISPMTGKVEPKSQTELKVTITPGMPIKFNETFTIQIGKFEDTQVILNLEGQFAQVELDIPRAIRDKSLQALNKKLNQNKVAAMKSTLQLPKELQSDDDDESVAPVVHTSEDLLKQEKSIMQNFLKIIKNERQQMFSTRNDNNSILHDADPIASYDVEFGTIVLGDSKSQKFTIKNMAHFPISFNIDASQTKRTGFKVEPTNFQNIPEGESVTVEASFSVANYRSGTTGEVSIPIPIVFNDGHRIDLAIACDLKIPSLSLSQPHFDFGQVIIGQTKIMTLQLQNMNVVPIEYKFDPAQQVDILKRTAQKENANPDNPIFHVVPDSGVLPPSSFINIAIHFSPNSERPYQMQFPLNLKHSPAPSFVTVSGNGAQLTLNFNPPELELATTMPYSTPSLSTVIVSNPTKYPIDFFSLQFDTALNNTEEQNAREAESPFVTYTPKVKAPNASKFAYCIIVDGPPLSGKTTLANNLSDFFGLPVINLEEFLALDANEQVPKLLDYLNDIKFMHGFIVDGYGKFKEQIAQVDEQFIQHQVKAKKDALDDIVAHPMSVYSNQVMSSYCNALDVLLKSLDGHYVFHIALGLTPEQVMERKDYEDNKKKRQERRERREEALTLFEMTEEEYNALSPEKQEEVDAKRRKYRKVPKIEEPEGNEKDKKKSSRKRSKKDKEKEEKEEEKKKEEEKPQIPKKKTKTSIPTDPYQFMTLVYLLSVGLINQKLSKGSDHYKVVDPSQLNTIEKGPNVSLNSLYVNAFAKPESVLETVKQFLPSIMSLKEYAFKGQIPQPIVIDDNVTADAMRLWPKIPKCFYISDVDPAKLKPGDLEVGRRVLTPKWHLEPGQEMTMPIVFDPVQQIGSLNDQLMFAIEKSSTPPIALKVKAISALPAVDLTPKSIFPKIFKKYDPKNAPCFVLETNTVNFGYCLPTKERGKNPPKYTMPITICNTGKMPAEVTTMFSNCQQKQTTWSCEPAAFTVPPNDKVSVTLGFNPTTVEVHKALFNLIVKDNPDPFFFDVEGECCNPSIEVAHPQIEFDKILINSEKQRKLEIKNIGKVVAYWHIKNANQLGGQVTFNVLEGMISPKGTTTIIAKMMSSKPVQLKKGVTIEVLDQDKSHVFESVNIPITGEVFDVNFDVAFTKSNTPDTLDYGLMKVGQSKSATIGMKNRGKYPVNFKATVDPKLARFLTLQPTEGTVTSSDKNPQIVATFDSSSVLKFNVQEGVVLQIIDSQTKAVTATLKYPVIAQAVYNSYTVSCGHGIDFGSISSLQNVTKEFQIKNTGLFPIEYEIRDKTEAKEQEKNSAKKAPAKPPPKKGKPTSSTGPFSLNPMYGTIHPGQTQTVSVEFNTSTPGKQASSFVLSVNETAPNEGTTTLKFRGVSFTPTLSMSQPDKVFGKLPLCIRIDLARKEMNCFIEDDQTIHFAPRIVSQKDSIPFTLTNTLPIDCPVDLVIKPKAKGPCPFDVDMKTINITTNSSQVVNLTFAPPTCDAFQATLEVIAKGGTTTAKYNLEGSGALPSVTMITQLDKQKNGYMINMGKTLIGTDKSREISFINDKLIAANVTVNAKPTPDFELLGLEQMNFTVPPGQTFKLNFVHRPQKARKSQLDVTITVADNPKFSVPISAAGEGFCEDVQFEGIGDDNDLHFVDAVVGRGQNATFMLKNVSDSDIRFVFSSQSEISFVPRIGHLRRFQVKEITSTFFCDKPLKLSPGKAACQITKIDLDEDAQDWDDAKRIVTFIKRSELEAQQQALLQQQLEQQQQQQTSAKSSKNQKNQKEPEKPPVVEKPPEVPPISKNPNEMIRRTSTAPEPAYKVVPGSKPHDIPLKVFVVSDQIKYTIDTTEISFAPTMMFQNRTTEVHLTNTCSIRIEYTWSLKKFESLRTNYAKTAGPAFTIRPTTGFIEPGQTTTFKVVFAPLEVDDFKGILECSIGYLIGESPKIMLSALSRRPLCHFNVEPSDYLQHRHPDFTYALPEGVRVIEFFAKAPGSRTVKRIEMINPTADLYETVWTPANEQSTECIKCDSNSALVSSGKHYFFTFSYTPKTARLIESLWEFEIPKHGIKVPFLFVGRIAH